MSPMKTATSFACMDAPRIGLSLSSKLRDFPDNGRKRQPEKLCREKRPVELCAVRNVTVQPQAC